MSFLVQYVKRKVQRSKKNVNQRFILYNIVFWINKKDDTICGFIYEKDGDSVALTFSKKKKLLFLIMPSIDKTK